MGIEALNENPEPVSEKLKSLRSHDEHDHWLVQEIGYSGEDYERATHVLIGCPQDEGVVRNNGRPGASEAPDKIRERLYKMQVPENTDISVYDSGNIIFDSLEQSHIRLTQAVTQFLEHGKKVITLGGGNDISYADVRALSKVFGEISAINIDAHLDMRQAEEMTSGTPYQKLIKQKLLAPDRFHEFGIQPASNAEYYLKDARNLGVHIYELDEILHYGSGKSFSQVLKKTGECSLFLGLDMDSIRAADAPGVSASSPIGFSAREVLGMIRQAKAQKNLKLFEITEVNPAFDIDNRTVKLAAALIWEFLKP